MTIYSNGKSQPSEKGSVRHVPLIPFVADVVELLPAGGSAWVMSEFMHQMRSTAHLPDTWQVLTACIIYGCSVASFLHRRRLRDPNMSPIFAACVSFGMLVGKCTGAGFDYIMLVHVSWATCLAMVASAICLHIQPRLNE
ncbi:unnamed protein product [Fusarium fujikuroi]|nr:unnamed protein product [Fusarium fujikuroi]